MEAMYGPTGNLSGIRLTKVGKTLMGRPVESNHQNDPLPPADILEMVRQLKRAHPEWEITFEIRLKEQNELLSCSTVNN